MTKCYFFSILIFLSCAVNGQIKKESILLGGQIFYFNSKNEFDHLDQKSESGTFGISIGKAIKENKIVGINFSFSPMKLSQYLINSDTTNSSGNRINAGIFYREYKKLAKDLYFFSQVDAAFITATQKDIYKNASGTVQYKQRGESISLTPGISYLIFKKMQLEITLPNILYVQHMVTKFNSTVPQVFYSKQNQFTFSSNLSNNTGLGSLGVGFRFIL